MKKITLIFFFLISTLTFSKVLLESTTTSPSINQPFNLQVKFIDEDKEDYEILGIENLQILSKGSQSKISIINGNKTSEKIDTYTVLATQIKNFDLSIETKNKKNTSNTLSIQVLEENIKSLNNEMSLETNIKDNSTFYFGEKILFEEKFLTTVSVDSINYTTYPSFNEFSIKETTPLNNRGQYIQNYFTTQDGKNALEVLLYQGILTPNSSGVKKITLGNINVVKSSSRRDFFNFNTNPPLYLGGNTLNLNILPLPSNKPVNFQNVVGTPKVDFSWNKDEVNIGDSILLNIKIYGNVNLDTLDKIINTQTEDFNIFESIKAQNENIKNGKYYSEKEFEIAFIPKKAGEISIPEITIPYFDTESKIYKFLIIPSKKINVIGSSIKKSINENSVIDNFNNNVDSKNGEIEKKEIIIDSLPELENQDNIYNLLIIGLLIVSIVEFIIIILLTIKNKKFIISSDLSQLKKATNNKDFYGAYCELMKKEFNFNPKVHLEDKLVKLNVSQELIFINRELEDAYYNNKEIDRKNIIKRIKKELKNGK